MNNSIVVILLVLLGIGFAVYLVACQWRIISKSGDHGAKVLIPVYGAYVYYKACDSTGVFWGNIVTSAVGNIITSIIVSTSYKAYSYGRYSYSIPEVSPAATIIAIIEGIVLLCLQISLAVNTAKAFNKPGGFAAGLFFLAPIFLGILAFGNAEHYNQKVLNQIADRWTCPNCGHENSASRAQCIMCKAAKAGSTMNKPEPISAPVAPDNWKCRKCGNSNPNSHAFCLSCGEPR